MKKNITLALIVCTFVLFVSWSNFAEATFTLDANSIVSTTTITLTPATASATLIGAAAGTGSITLGSSTAAQTILVGNGVNAAAQTVSIANGASAAATTVNIMSGVGTAGVGIINIGNNTRVTTIDIGDVAPAAARTTTIAGGDSAQNDTVDILPDAPSANTQTFNLLTGIATGGTQTVNILSGTGGTKALNLGTGASAKTITVGNITGVTLIDILAGTDGIELTGQLVTKGTAPVATQSAGNPTLTATSTDTAGIVVSDTTSHTTVIITFDLPYTTAPACVISPADAEAAAIMGSATGAFGTTSTTALTITHAADSTVATWHYMCIELE